MHDYEFITESNYIILPKVATTQWQQGVFPMGGSHQEHNQPMTIGLPEAPFIRQKCI